MTKNNEGILIEEHSVTDLFNRLDYLSDKINQIHQQTLKTNGRVTNLEARSIGLWISNNPFKFFIIGILLSILCITEFREPIFLALIKLF